MIKKIIALIILLPFTIAKLKAQDPLGDNWLEDTMYSSGKINVVIVVLAIAFLGITIFLFSIERKLKKIEKNIKN
jgi:CcmD family protein